MNTTGVPIIGQTKTWKKIRFVCQPIGKPPLIAVPNAEPEVTHWMFGFQGVRSDALPVQSVSVIPVEEFTDARAMMVLMGTSVQQFESFRACDCLPKIPCALHRDLAQRPS